MATLVLEDDPLVRRGIVEQVNRHPEFRVVAQVGDLAAARAQLARQTARLGIFDLQLPDGSALQLIPEAVSRGMAILVLTIWDDDDTLYRALAAGAGGYVLKDDATHAGRLAHALASLRDGGAPISPAIARRILDEVRPRLSRAAEASRATELSSLSDREREILELFAKGATYEEVGALLGLSVNTIRYHVRNMYKKLHVCSKAEAVTLALGRR